MNVDEPVKSSTRKRKRSVPTQVKIEPGTSRGGRGATATPSGQVTRRQRMQSSTARSVNAEATRVFARWERNSSYYPGYVQGRSNATYAIRFDDGEDACVDLQHLRRCELRPGDEVYHNQEGLATTVRAGDLTGPKSKVTIEAKGETTTVNLAELSVSGKVIAVRWEDRKLRAEDVVPNSVNWVDTPTPSRRSTANGFGDTFEGFGFVLSSLADPKEKERRTANLKRLIQSQGGTIVEDWSEIYPIEQGQWSQRNSRWEAKASEIRYKEPAFSKVFLVSDIESTKPKYLMALALGVPCLDESRMKEFAEGVCTIKHWREILLPAGSSSTLSGKMSQHVDLEWGEKEAHMSSACTDESKAMRVFKDMSILLIGADYLPETKSGRGRRASSVDNESARFVPMIILFMGAKRVVTASDLGTFKPKELGEFDYVIVKDPHAVGLNHKAQTTYISFDWVKDCLISNRLHARLY
ncbi:hypothetical protein K488DRAFT_42135 [Vararia minispora EC-137]|uniref:Uncharacterized protein n=1 Tax=Vararia minispora EC-137 TaxID=1314806 RepID=A0ACB8QVV7_9AGAM|nr:hypothetical protein K488DRAFT_42135 [Vararia minispora EC-137]